MFAFRNVAITGIFIFHSTFAFAADDAPTKYEYPELLVQPQASERLKTEAKNEPSSAWTMHLPIQASAALTLLAGMGASSDKADKGEKTDKEKQLKAQSAGQIASAVGGGWLLTTVLMSALYHPYRSGMADLPKKDNDKAAKLVRERAAEEALNAPASLANRLTWLSFGSNFLVSGYVFAVSQGQNTKGMAMLGVLASFTPLVFSYDWERTAEQQQDYKKRIYGPITSGTILYNEQTKTLAPAFTASISL
jgi:hypothetical protein